MVSVISTLILRSTILLEKLAVAQLTQKRPVFYEAGSQLHGWHRPTNGPMQTIPFLAFQYFFKDTFETDSLFYT